MPPKPVAAHGSTDPKSTVRRAIQPAVFRSQILLLAVITGDRGQRDVLATPGEAPADQGREQEQALSAANPQLQQPRHRNKDCSNSHTANQWWVTRSAPPTTCVHTHTHTHVPAPNNKVSSTGVVAQGRLPAEAGQQSAPAAPPAAALPCIPPSKVNSGLDLPHDNYIALCARPSNTKQCVQGPNIIR